MIGPGARYYDPGTGRFLSEDPLGIKQSLNLFIYARNNPLYFYDPYGLFDWVGFGSGVIQVLGGTSIAVGGVIVGGQMSVGTGVIGFGAGVLIAAGGMQLGGNMIGTGIRLIGVMPAAIVSKSPVFM